MLRGSLEVGKLFDAYRPELHYMRGPGPKWYAKHSGLPVPVESGRFQLPRSTWLLTAAAIGLLGLAAAVALA